MEFIYIATFFVALISSILSGMAGGGGGFIMAPYWLIFAREIVFIDQVTDR